MITRETKVKFKVWDTQKGQMSIQKNQGGASLDFLATEDIYLKLGEQKIVGLGIRVELPWGKWMVLKERSSLATKMGTMMMARVIDKRYRGELKAVLYSTSLQRVKIAKGTPFV